MQKNWTLPFNGKKEYTDWEVVNGLQQRERKVEEWFYRTTKRYFNAHFNEVFFDEDQKQEIFQTAFLKLWTEIQNGKISIVGDAICRQQRNGEYLPMNCKLTTFLFTFAKNEYRELVRSAHLTSMVEMLDSEEYADEVAVFVEEEDIDALKRRIVDDCMQKMSPRCLELLTLFYYENKSLDEILEQRKDKNSSKDGLKTAKNKCMNTLRSKVAAECQRLCVEPSMNKFMNMQQEILNDELTMLRIVQRLGERKQKLDCMQGWESSVKKPFLLRTLTVMSPMAACVILMLTLWKQYSPVDELGIRPDFTEFRSGNPQMTEIQRLLDASEYEEALVQAEQMLLLSDAEVERMDAADRTHQDEVAEYEYHMMHTMNSELRWIYIYLLVKTEQNEMALQQLERYIGDVEYAHHIEAAVALREELENIERTVR